MFMDNTLGCKRCYLHNSSNVIVMESMDGLHISLKFDKKNRRPNSTRGIPGLGSFLVCLWTVPVETRTYPHQLFEYPAEIEIIFVAGLFRDLGDRKIRLS